VLYLGGVPLINKSATTRSVVGCGPKLK